MIKYKHKYLVSKQSYNFCIFVYSYSPQIQNKLQYRTFNGIYTGNLKKYCIVSIYGIIMYMHTLLKVTIN